MAWLDKQQGAYLGGADAAQVFGRGKALSTRQLDAQEQTNGMLDGVN